MPVSDYNQISDVLSVIVQTEPSRVLDVGVGFGKWGILCREVLEATHGRLSPSQWQIQIDGIEIFEDYKNPLWDLAYDNIYIGDALSVMDKLEKYDIVIACDVIEHFDKKSGKIFLDKLVSLGKIVIVTSPRGHFPQGEVWGNKYEEHLSEWRKEDFRSFSHLYKDISCTFMAILSKDKSALKTLHVSHPLDTLGVKKGFLELTKMSIFHLRDYVKRMSNPSRVETHNTDK